MDIQRLLRRYRTDWRELEELLAAFSKASGRIESGQIRRLTYLYKKASSHLALIQTRHPHDELTGYLNRLVSEAHHTLYQEKHRSARQLSAFFRSYLIGMLSRRRLFIAAAALLFVLGALSGFAAVLANPDNLYAVLPQQIAGHVDPSRTGEGLADAPHALVSTQIMTNNIRVAVLAFVSGITFGIWTVYLLAFNGILVGALAAVYWKAGESYLFWAYILPHGVIELTAIFIAGGAGLYMGYRMFVPGPYPWKLQLLQSAKESVQLLLSTVPLFIVAGIIEGYITPSSLSLETKYAVAILTLLVLAAYCVYGSIHMKRTAVTANPAISAPGND
jgi:uncharacterized membrane protein SpoIIM required for sporulation